jgi:hypothetical protein
MSWTTEQIKDALRAVAERSRTDAKFRELALKDAGAAVAEVASAPMPAGLKVRFVAKAGYDITVVLPEVGQEGEIGDEQMAGIAGGRLGYGLGG